MVICAPTSSRILERLGQRLSHWANLPDVDLEQIKLMQQESSQLSRNLLNSPRPGARLKEDRLLGSIRQRFSIPGGLCAFDVPQLHHWLGTRPSPVTSRCRAG